MKSDVAITEQATVLWAMRESCNAEPKSPHVIDLSTTELSVSQCTVSFLAVCSLWKKLWKTCRWNWVLKCMNIVRCSDVLSVCWWREESGLTTLPSKFKPYGMDAWGLTCELWRLFGRHMQRGLCERKGNCLVIRQLHVSYRYTQSKCSYHLM